ncbi:hypothetical protein LU276_07775 [Moraxella haemolytica]|uniref:hypothetical protein n=1 Tax=Moraxella haemolytica TaxID=2904119 RepID=UPI002542B107|nr:hypothetical protein [Moraxella sp. ZY171148]WII94907.1 hypothetical protein LU276_07775 [Moraxella sp. ZY171148]
MLYTYLIDSLHAYLDGRLEVRLLLDIWKGCPSEISGIYYQLFHLVSDEDIRKKDSDYARHQLYLVEILIDSLKLNDVKKLQNFSLI